MTPTNCSACRGPASADPDILGAIFFDDRRIVIDESLDPEENPSKEGRYRFTLAHEGGGHWRLHRHLFAKDPAQASMFGRPAIPSVICRSSQAKKREEWQADFYSSCLLMPRKLVFAAWDAVFPDRKPRVLQPRTAFSHPYVEIRRIDLSNRRSIVPRLTTKRLIALPSPSLRPSSSRRSRCASDWKSLGCCIAKFHANAFLPVALRPLF